MSSQNIHTSVPGERCRVYDCQVSARVGDCRHCKLVRHFASEQIMGNILNEGNTVGLFTTVQIVKNQQQPQPSSSSSSPSAGSGTKNHHSQQQQQNNNSHRNSQPLPNPFVQNGNTINGNQNTQNLQQTTEKPKPDEDEWDIPAFLRQRN